MGGRQQPSMFWRVVTSSTTWSVVLLVVVFVFIGWAVWGGSRPLVDQLPNQEFARGLITLLFVLFTIGFAAIVLIHGLFVSDVTQEDRRFARGREVLGLFIGIVGTIVGFYFGSAEKAPTKLDVAVNAQRQSEKKVAISAHVAGGTPPYQFTITLGSKKTTDQPLKSPDGWLSTEIDGNGATEVTVEASDLKDLKGTKKEKIKDTTKDGKK